MPVSVEQWRASVGANNSAHSHILKKCFKVSVNLLDNLTHLVALFAVCMKMVMVHIQGK